MQKAYRQRFESYFSHIPLPELIPKDLIAQKLEQLRKGDQVIRDQLILHYMRLVFAIAARVNGKIGQKGRSDDLVLEGLYSLVRCLDRIARNEGMTKHDNLDRCIHATVYHDIIRFVSTDYTVRPPIESDWLKAELKKDSGIFEQLFHCKQYDEVEKRGAKDFEDATVRQKQMTATHGLATQSSIELLMLQDILESFYFTSKEKIIITRRIEGKTMAEIAKELGLSKVAIHKRLNEGIIPRLKQLIGE